MIMGNERKIFAGRWYRAAVLGLGLAALSGCEEGFKMPFGNAEPNVGTAAAARSTKLVERDVEAPEVFQVTEAGLWDGRPSLGGVWVAHPDVSDPERVIIRNKANSQFVIGALFRRERDMPGPRLQISSDAAAALGMLAGAPSELNVTALRREEVEAEPPASEDSAALTAPPEIAATTLDPVATAGAAIAAAEAKQATSAVQAVKPPAKPAKRTAATSASAPPPVESPVPVEAPLPAPAALAPAEIEAEASAAAAQSARPKSALAKPYVQIGIFSVEANAKSAADAMRAAGMVPTIKAQSTKGTKFWRVLIGPAGTESDRDALLKNIKSAGFSDAYAVDS